MMSYIRYKKLIKCFLSYKSASNFCFHKLSWRGYENKLKIACGHVINYFHKFFQTVSEVFLPANKFKIKYDFLKNIKPSLTLKN